MNQTTSPPAPLPAGVGGWSWPRLFRQLGVGPSAASMLALRYLPRPADQTPAVPPRLGGRS